MRILVRAAVAVLLPLGLAGCFSSDQPLIAEAESVTPVAPGRYSYSAAGEEKTYVLVTINGTATVLTSSDEEGKTEETVFLMRNLSDDHFIAMDRKTFDYSLIRVHDGTVEEYQEDAYCRKLQDLAKARGVDIASFGVVRVSNDEIAICYFESYAALAGAFAALLDEKLLEIGETYRRAD